MYSIFIVKGRLGKGEKRELIRMRGSWKETDWLEKFHSKIGSRDGRKLSRSKSSYVETRLCDKRWELGVWKNDRNEYHFEM